MKKLFTLCLIAVFSVGLAQDLSIDIQKDFSIDKEKIKRPGTQVPTNG